VQQAGACFICRKHSGEHAAPPGGYLYEDAHFRVCHAPAAMSVPGTLLVESRRHFLDFAEMTVDEAADYGLLLARLYGIMKHALGAERVYTLVTLEGAAHFHTWLIPRADTVQVRGLDFLTQDHRCTEAEALAALEALRAELG
jgi:diadenosine tetraphosphate (Ap4A) HIT family hydrolase